MTLTDARLPGVLQHLISATRLRRSGICAGYPLAENWKEAPLEQVQVNTLALVPNRRWNLYLTLDINHRVGARMPEQRNRNIPFLGCRWCWVEQPMVKRAIAGTHAISPPYQAKNIGALVRPANWVNHGRYQTNNAGYHRRGQTTIRFLGQILGCVLALSRLYRRRGVLTPLDLLVSPGTSQDGANLRRYLRKVYGC